MIYRSPRILRVAEFKTDLRKRLQFLSGGHDAGEHLRRRLLHSFLDLSSLPVRSRSSDRDHDIFERFFSLSRVVKSLKPGIKERRRLLLFFLCSEHSDHGSGIASLLLLEDLPVTLCRLSGHSFLKVLGPDVRFYLREHFRFIAKPCHQKSFISLDALVAEGQFAKAWATIYQVLSTINMADDAVEALLECATRGYLNFQKNWGRIAKTIHDINPDAQVVVISLFNGTQGLGALPGTNISIGNALDPIFNGMNARIVSCNAVHNYYRYIDITKVEHPAWPDVVTMLSGDFYGYMMLCTHPTRNGHKWIANKVLKAI